MKSKSIQKEIECNHKDSCVMTQGGDFYCSKCGYCSLCNKKESEIRLEERQRTLEEVRDEIGGMLSKVVSDKGWEQIKYTPKEFMEVLSNLINKGNE